MEPKVNIALEAARAGCKELLSFAYRLDQLEIKEKGPSNFVTQLDKKVESIIKSIETIVKIMIFKLAKLLKNSLKINLYFVVLTMVIRSQIRI